MTPQGHIKNLEMVIYLSLIPIQGDSNIYMLSCLQYIYY